MLVVTPVPPFVTAKVPATVIAPAEGVDGVKPVEPKEIDDTPAAAAAAQTAVVPLEVSTKLFDPIASLVALFAPLPMIKSPVVVIGDKALNAAPAVVCPVPPLVIASVPVRSVAETSPQDGANPAVPVPV